MYTPFARRYPRPRERASAATRAASCTGEKGGREPRLPVARAGSTEHARPPRARASSSWCASSA